MDKKIFLTLTGFSKGEQKLGQIFIHTAAKILLKN